MPIMSETPKILQKIGLADKPIFMTVHHFNNITHEEAAGHPEWHGLKDTEVAQAPILLNNPGIIADSMTDPTSIIIISNSPDYKQRPIMLALQTNGEGTGYEVVDSNFMTSMYGREKAESFINRLRKQNKILYMDNIKSHAIYQNLRVQFPSTLTTLGFNKIIHPSNNAVNTFRVTNAGNTDSDGNRLTYDQIKYFVHSKIRNKDGSLLVMHHGTEAYRQQKRRITPNCQCISMIRSLIAWRSC